MSVKSKWDRPPLVDNTSEINDYFLDLHDILFGLGADQSGYLVFIDADQTISGEWTFDTHPLGLDHGSIGGLTDDDHTQYHTDARAVTWHDSLTGNHSSLIQAVDPTDSTVSVDTANADATYGTPERDLINELKDDVNTLVSDYNALLAVLRTANLIA